MNAQYSLTLSSLILIIVLMLTSCGPGQFLGPTLTPLPTNTLTPTAIATSTSIPTATSTNTPLPTETPTILVVAKTGQWKGDTPSVSFKVTGNGQIQGLKITVPVGSSDCLIEAPDIEMFADGTFTFIDSFNSLEVNVIKGNFTSETTMNGVYGGGSILCKIMNLSFLFKDPQPESKFSASWKGP